MLIVRERKNKILYFNDEMNNFSDVSIANEFMVPVNDPIVLMNFVIVSIIQTSVFRGKANFKLRIKDIDIKKDFYLTFNNTLELFSYINTHRKETKFFTAEFTINSNGLKIYSEDTEDQS